MKTLIHSIQNFCYAICFLLGMHGFIVAQTTCTLDPTFVASPKYGIWPDSATNFVSGQVGVSYAQNITVKVPLDTVQPPIKICFTRFELLVPSAYPNYNLPPGLTLTGNPSNLKFPANANSCAIISGTPTTAGTYTLHFQVDVYGNTILSSQTCPTPVNPNSGSKISTENIDYYVIHIAPSADVSEYKNIQNISIHPNPVSNAFVLSFNTRQPSCISFQLVDITGKIIQEQVFNHTIGPQRILIDTHTIDNGIYFYKISDGKESMSNKIIIQH